MRKNKEGAFWGVKKNVFVLGLVSLFNDISSEMIYPLIPLFLVNVLGASKSVIGLIEGIALSTESILKLLSGWLSDRLGKRKVFVFWGYTLSALTKPLLSLSTLWSHVLLLRFADRAGKGVRTSPRDAIIASSSEEGLRGRSFGLHRSLDTLGAVIGPALTFLLLPLFNQDYRKIFLISFLPAILAVSLVLLFVSEKKALKEEDSSKLSLDFSSFSKEFKAFLFVSFLFALGNSSDAFLILRAQNLGITLIWIPLIYTMFNLVVVLVSLPAGVLSDKIGRKRVILIGFLVFFLAYSGFALASNSSQIWPLFAFYGFYSGLTEGVGRAFASDLLKSNQRGTGLGVYHFLIGIAALPASLIAGFLWQLVSPAATFSFGAGAALLSGIFLVALLK